MGNVSDIYPCKDSPWSCGWAKSELKEMVWESDLSLFCGYPSCWCKEWFVAAPLTNKTMEKGQPFVSIIYRGGNTKLAERIYNFLRSMDMRNKEIGLSDSRLKVQVKGINFVHMDGVYQVDITGELL